MQAEETTRALDDLVEAVGLFAARHEEALQKGQPGRTLEAVEGLHGSLDAALPAEAGRIHNAVLALGRTPPRTPGDFAAAYGRFQSGDAFEREAWGFSALGKRLAEAQGALLHLRLTLVKGSADGPAGRAFHHRLAGETTTVLRTLAGLRVALDAWAASVRVALQVPSPPAPPPPHPRDLLRAARECLLAGAPEGAAGPLRRALLAGLAGPLGVPPGSPGSLLEAWARVGLPLPAPRRDLEAAFAALDGGTADPILAWRLLDFVEAAVQRAAVTPRAPVPARAPGAGSGHG